LGEGSFLRTSLVFWRHREGSGRKQIDRRVLFGAIAGVVIAVFVAYRMNGFPVRGSYLHLIEEGKLVDLIHERLTAWEAIWGNPHRPLSEILSEHGYVGGPPGAAPRTPAALLLQLPLLLLPEGVIMVIATSLVLA
jgi:hypothetical protein